MKRKLLWCLLAVVFSFRLIYGQADASFYDNKINKFNHLRTGGFIMAGAGTGLAFAGTIMLMDLPSGYWSGDYNVSASKEVDYLFQAVGGVIFTALGVGLMAGGLTMSGIASKKIRYYKEQKNKLSMGILLSPNRQGITLTYRF